MFFGACSGLKVQIKMQTPSYCLIVDSVHGPGGVLVAGAQTGRVCPVFQTSHQGLIARRVRETERERERVHRGGYRGIRSGGQSRKKEWKGGGTGNEREGWKGEWRRQFCLSQIMLPEKHKGL